MDIYEQKLLAAIKKLRPSITFSNGNLTIRYPNGSSASVKLPTNESIRKSSR